jgi:hypothetical protein
LRVSRHIKKENTNEGKENNIIVKNKKEKWYAFNSTGPAFQKSSSISKSAFHLHFKNEKEKWYALNHKKNLDS